MLEPRLVPLPETHSPGTPRVGTSRGDCDRRGSIVSTQKGEIRTTHEIPRSALLDQARTYRRPASQTLPPTFGIGNHFCLGANLARMELRVALTELLRRIPEMAYAAGGPEVGASVLIPSVLHMHVRFTPERLG